MTEPKKPRRRKTWTAGTALDAIRSLQAGLPEARKQAQLKAEARVLENYNAALKQIATALTSADREAVSRALGSPLPEADGLDDTIATDPNETVDSASPPLTQADYEDAAEATGFDAEDDGAVDLPNDDEPKLSPRLLQQPEPLAPGAMTVVEDKPANERRTGGARR